MFKKWSAALPFLFVLSLPVQADDKSDKAARETVNGFFKVFKAKDVDGVMKHFDVPFLFEGKTIVKDRDVLKKEWADVIKEKDSADYKSTIIETATLDKIAADLKKNKMEIGEETLKKLNEVLGNDHLMVVVEVEDGKRKDKIVFAVRFSGAKASIVAILD